MRNYNRKYNNYYSKKWENEHILYTAKVIRIEEQNKEIGDKLKTVFFIESKIIPEGRMCVTWGRTTFHVGDEVNLTGRLQGEIFLVWSHTYRRIEKEEGTS